MKITIDIPEEYTEKIVLTEMEQILEYDINCCRLHEDKRYYQRLKAAAKIIRAYYEIP